MDLYTAGLFTVSAAASACCDEVQQLFEESLLYLRRAVGSLLLGFPGESFLLLVQRLGLQDHLLQLKRRVAVQSPLLRGTQTLRHRLCSADIFMHFDFWHWDEALLLYLLFIVATAHSGGQKNFLHQSVHFKMATRERTEVVPGC